MGKIKVTPELFAKAEEVFSKAKDKTIRTNEGLSRTELRALFRAGFVERIPAFAERKWANVAPTKYYIWRWKK